MHSWVGDEIRVHLIYIEIRNSPDQCCLVEGEIIGKPWYHDIKQFIECHKYPLGASKADKKTLRRMTIE